MRGEEWQRNICVDGACVVGPPGNGTGGNWTGGGNGSSGGGSCSGCSFDGTCYPDGRRLEGQYCNALDREFQNQMPNGAYCDNNFECAGNSCINGKCKNVGFFVKLLCTFLHPFSGEKREACIAGGEPSVPEEESYRLSFDTNYDSSADRNETTIRNLDSGKTWYNLYEGKMFYLSDVAFSIDEIHDTVSDEFVVLSAGTGTTFEEVVLDDKKSMTYWKRMDGERLYDYVVVEYTL
jgi:hypothetical protein